MYKKEGSNQTSYYWGKHIYKKKTTMVLQLPMPMQSASTPDEHQKVLIPQQIRTQTEPV
jgi:hypothetical protein